MDDETKTGEENAENNNEEEETSVGEAEEEKTKEETTEEDPYEVELNRLEAERVKAETIANQKGGALKEERLKNKALEDRISKLEASGKSVDTDALVEKLRAEIKVDSEIEKLSQNPKEQELIRYYIKNNSLSPYDAWVLANKGNLTQAQQRVKEVDEEEAALARLSGVSAGGGVDKTDPFLKLASEGLTEAEKKHLKA